MSDYPALREAVLALADDWDDFEHDPITCPKYECSDCTMKNAVHDLRTCVWSVTGGFACPTCSGRAVWMDEPCSDCAGRGVSDDA